MKVLKGLTLLFLLLCLAGCAVSKWQSTMNKAATHYDKGEYAEATREAESALMIVKEDESLRFRLRDTVFGLAITLHHWASDHASRGRVSEAESLYKRALSTIEENVGSENFLFADMLLKLARIHQKKEENDEAEALFKRSLSIVEGLDCQHPLILSLLLNLGELYQKQDQYALAKTPYERAYKIMEGSVGETHPQFAEMMERLADIYEKSGKNNKAKQLRERADEIWSIIVDQIEIEQNQKVKILFDERDWRVGHAVLDGKSLVEYVLHDESVHTWTELITVQSWPKRKFASGMTSKEAAQLFRVLYDKSKCPNSIRRDIPSNNGEIMYEQTFDCPRSKKEFGIFKMMYGQNGVHSVSYSKMSPLSVEERNKWIDLIGKATLIIPRR